MSAESYSLAFKATGPNIDPPDNYRTNKEEWAQDKLGATRGKRRGKLVIKREEVIREGKVKER